MNYNYIITEEIQLNIIKFYNYQIITLIISDNKNINYKYRH